MFIRSLFITLCVLSLDALSDEAADELADYEQWKKHETVKFTEYRDIRDKEFSQYLKNQWHEMQIYQGLKQDKIPKPVNIPVVIEQTTPEPVIKSQIQNEKLIRPAKINQPTLIKLALPTSKIPIETIPEKLSSKKIVFNFYGIPLSLFYDADIAVSFNGPVNEHTISRFWSDLSKTNYISLLDQLSIIRNSLQLNDWSYALLIHNISGHLHPDNKNTQVIFTWYLLTKTGYQARIAYDKTSLYLLMSSKQALYSTSYFTFNNILFYVLDFDNTRHNIHTLYTYNGQYPEATKPLNMTLDHSFITSGASNNRLLEFNYKKINYRINVPYNTQIIDFLNTYPQMDISMYFHSSVNTLTAYPVLKQLAVILQGKSEEESVNILLRFVQTAFNYQTDKQQFGLENYLLPEETLYYPSSDCEDRSVFFAWLVSSLLNLDVIGLDYPGHVSTAVNFTDRLTGDAVEYKGKRYLISDPTYKNARVGMTMPNYKNIQPVIIE